MISKVYWKCHTPMISQFAAIAETNFVSYSQPHIAHLQFRKEKPCSMFLIQSEIPANDDPILSLCFFQFSIIVGLSVDKRSKDVLINICICVLKLNRLKLVING